MFMVHLIGHVLCLGLLWFVNVYNNHLIWIFFAAAAAAWITVLESCEIKIFEDFVQGLHEEEQADVLSLQFQSLTTHHQEKGKLAVIIKKEKFPKLISLLHKHHNAVDDEKYEFLKKSSKRDLQSKIFGQDVTMTSLACKRAEALKGLCAKLKHRQRLDVLEELYINFLLHVNDENYLVVQL